MQVQTFCGILGADFYTGVPDSQLKPLCNYLMNTYGTDPRHHVIAANEGNSTALAAGYHLATGGSRWCICRIPAREISSTPSPPFCMKRFTPSRCCLSSAGGASRASMTSRSTFFRAKSR